MHDVIIILGLIAYASVDTATEYGDSLHYHDEAVNFTSSKASTYYLVGSTVNSSDKLVSLIRHAATQLPDEDSEAESVRVTGKC